jgi:hypothetical protein
VNCGGLAIVQWMDGCLRVEGCAGGLCAFMAGREQEEERIMAGERQMPKRCGDGSERVSEGVFVGAGGEEGKGGTGDNQTRGW